MDAAPEYSFTDGSVRKAYKIGFAGGILHIGGKYLVYEGMIDYDNESGWGMSIKYGECLVLDEEGNRTGTLDLSVFGTVRGVFGGKYIIGEHRLDESEWIEDPVYGTVTTETNLYTLSGELVMRNVFPYPMGGFCAEEEIYAGWICTSYCLRDGNGVFYDKDLNRIDEPSEEELRLNTHEYMKYFAIESDERIFVSNGVFAGIKDKDGNWLFRIYDPKGANDNDNERSPSWYRPY